MPTELTEPQAPRFRLQALLGYALVILTVAGPSLFSLGVVYAAANARERTVADADADAALARHLRGDGLRMSASLRGYLLTGAPDFLATLDAARTDFQRTADRLKSETRSLKGGQVLEEASESATRYSRSVDRLIRRVESGGAAANTPLSAAELGRTFEADVAPLSVALDRALDAYVAERHDQIGPAEARAQGAFRRLVGFSIGGLALAVLVGVLFANRASHDLARLYGQECKAKDSATRALAAQEEVLGIVAHDLRSPLGAIALKASLIRRGLMATKVREQAESIQRVVSQMDELIGTLLDAFTIENGRLSIAPVRLGLEGLMQEILDIFADQTDASHVRLTCTASPPGLAVMADHGRTIQALSNLVGNALKFTPEGGEITVAVRGTGAEVRFCVSDTGPGIDPAHLPHVFDRLWKAEIGGKKGTGLGLFVAKAIVEAHGGRIWAESTPETGATFSFTLPRAPEGERRTEPQPADTAPVRA